MAVRIAAATDVYSDVSGLGLPTGDFTLTFWAYMSVDRAALAGIVSLQAAGFSNWYIVGAQADGTITVFTNGNNLSPSYAPGVGAWNKYAFVKSGTAGTLYAGSEAGALNQVSSGTITTSTPVEIYIGGTSDSTQWFNGRLAAVKLWSTAFTQPQCAAEVAQFDPVIASNLLRYYKFHVAETTDYSGNGFTLTGVTPATEADPSIPDVVAPPSVVPWVPIRIMQVP